PITSARISRSACSLPPLFQRSRLDNEAIFDIASHNAFVRFVDIIDVDLLDVAGDAAIGAEIEHLLGLGDSANERPRETMTPADQTKSAERHRFGWRAEQAKCAVALEQIQIRVEVVLGRDGVENKIESLRTRVHRVFIF